MTYTVRSHTARTKKAGTGPTGKTLWAMAHFLLGESLFPFGESLFPFGESP